MAPVQVIAEGRELLMILLRSLQPVQQHQRAKIATAAATIVTQTQGFIYT